MSARVALSLLSALSLSLAACVSSDVSVYGQVDQSDKTITVPPGNSLLVGAIKQRLQSSGWKLVVDAGPTRTVGTLGANTDLATGKSFRTRYRLVLRQSQFDICIIGGAAINYDLSLIDNQSGEEVISESGHDCEARALEKFADALNGNVR
jgi:hypothetical protein